MDIWSPAVRHADPVTVLVESRTPWSAAGRRETLDSGTRRRGRLWLENHASSPRFNDEIKRFAAAPVLWYNRSSGGRSNVRFHHASPGGTGIRTRSSAARSEGHTSEHQSIMRI